MEAKKSLTLRAFGFACVPSAIATVGLILRWSSDLLSTPWRIGYELMKIGALGFVFGAFVTGGHQATAVAIAITGTFINVGFYFLLFLALLTLIEFFRTKTLS